MSIYVLDANIVSFYLKGHTTVIENIENALSSGSEIFIAPMAYYEVKRGLISVGAWKQLQKFEHFCRMFAVGEFSNSILDISAEIYAELRKKGRVVEDADIFIAAFCLKQGFTLVTHNTKHFEHITDLVLLDWVAAQSD
jgi:tRNA(fMet)-specific endonuclease VapC